MEHLETGCGSGDITAQCTLHSAVRSPHGVPSTGEMSTDHFGLSMAAATPDSQPIQPWQATLKKFWNQAQTMFGSHVNLYEVSATAAPPHIAKTTLKWVGDHFDDRPVSSGASRKGPAFSFGLAPMNFSYGFISRVMSTKKDSESLCNLEKVIIEAVRAIPADMCRRAIASATRRAALCLPRESDHFGTSAMRD